jgi:branched-chain amino acid transport system substrate-binding protein
MKKFFISSVLLMYCFTGSAADAPLQGVTDTEIKIGAHTISTGLYAWAVSITESAKAYLDMINDQGGINGRKVKLIYYDTGYQPAKALEVTKKLINDDKVMAMFFGLGTTNQATFRYTQSKNIFDFFPIDNVSIYDDKFSKTTFTLVPSWLNEARIIADYIIENYKGKKVGFLYVNDVNGKEGYKAIKKYLEGKVTFGPAEMFDPSATTANSQVLNLKKANVDVVYLHHEPPTSANAVKFAFEQGFKPKWIGTSWNVSDIFIDTAGKEAAEGVMAVHFSKLVTDNDPAVKKHIEMMKKYRKDIPPDQWTVSAQIYSEYLVEVLKRAGKNLTQDSIIKAAESIKDWTCTLCLSPGTFSPTQHRGMTSMRLYTIKGGHWALADDKLRSGAPHN